MKRNFFNLLLLMLLSGCSSTELANESFIDNEKSDAAYTKLQDKKMRLVGSPNRNNVTSDVWTLTATRIHTNKNINHYVRGIMQELLSTLQYVNSATPVAVADFVFLGGDYQKSTLLGKQLAEAFTHEVHKLGIPVVDYKLTDYIRVSPQGSLALTQDYLELSGDLPIRYVLTGTLVEQQDEILVNARVVGIKSKAIVASAQGAIPNDIATMVTSVNGRDGIYY
ncbi:MAG: hypothetical protein HWE10_03475 [Gammaproteobacteria bacterium]|nr:hypothetical protein [Gammaproteobacteria bacterium]